MFFKQRKRYEPLYDSMDNFNESSKAVEDKDLLFQSHSVHTIQSLNESDTNTTEPIKASSSEAASESVELHVSRQPAEQTVVALAVENSPTRPKKTVASLYMFSAASTADRDYQEGLDLELLALTSVRLRHRRRALCEVELKLELKILSNIFMERTLRECNMM